MKTLSSHAAAAKMIRQELKTSFPEIVFSVKSRSYSGGCSIDVRYTNGPTEDLITPIIEKYEMGSFCGMQDLYEYTNRNDNIPQVKYVFLTRDITDDILAACFAYVQKSYCYFDSVSSMEETSEIIMKHWNAWTGRQFVCRLLNKYDLTKGFIPKETDEGR